MIISNETLRFFIIFSVYSLIFNKMNPIILTIMATLVVCFQDAPIILLPNKPINLEVAPYELYDLYVPVNALD